MKKRCYVCKKELDQDQFTTHKRRKDGLQSQCINCQREYRREHYRNNIAYYVKKAEKSRKNFSKWWQKFKSQFACSSCGEKHFACIDFHHIDDSKEANVSELVSKQSRKQIMKEIEKCIPLCSNCHRKLHYEQRFSKSKC